jgi:hypothetical protein
MSRGCYEELLVIDIPEIDVSPTRHVGHELAEPPMRVTAAKFLENLDKIARSFIHGRTSLIVGYLATSRLGRV